MVVGTPSQENATRYVNFEAITVASQDHEVSAYVAALHATCKGVIRGIPLSDSPEAIDRKIVNARDPLALGAKRIKTTSAVIVQFDGYKVPNYVSYGGTLIKCTLYRKQVDVCYACGRFGHRSDVCPTLQCAGLAENISSKNITFLNRYAVCAAANSSLHPGNASTDIRHPISSGAGEA
ncbi:hypothetical protein HPB50_010631 [Hyalomma asiaticum]|uniref:Uncharacterized protein n=1 Tax=Hyalomma asiaticum TaxID=266040 RepID=A0ACB7SG31_HYAAI|nr:hypothetical protein HPB50_010631 [Hyalomma asiaticum]